MNNYTTQYLKKKKKSCITIYIKLKQNLSVFHHLYIFVDINSDDDQLEKQDHSSFEQFFYIIQQTNEPERDFFFFNQFFFLNRIVLALFIVDFRLKFTANAVYQYILNNNIYYVYWVLYPKEAECSLYIPSQLCKKRYPLSNLVIIIAIQLKDVSTKDH